MLGFADVLFSFLSIEESFKKGVIVSFVGLSERFGELIFVFFFVVQAGIWSLMPSLFVIFRKPYLLTFTFIDRGRAANV